MVGVQRILSIFRDSLLPAEVSIQDVVDLLHGGVRVLLQEGVQLHHHARAGGEEIFDFNWMTNI